MSVTIRPAVKEDYQAVAALGFESEEIHSQAYPDIFREGVSGIPLEYFTGMIEGTDTTVFVAEVDKQVVGHVFLYAKESLPYSYLLPRRIAEISDITVLRAYHNKGIGRQLVAAAVQWAKMKGAVDLQLEVWEFNNNAIAFYERLGMAPINRTMRLHL